MLPSTWGILGLGVVLSLGTAYHFYKVNDLNNDIAEKDKKILVMQSDIDTLKSSNDSLNNRINRINQINSDVMDENETLRNKNIEVTNQLNARLAEIASEKRSNQINKLRNSNKAELLLDIINKSAECQILNYGKRGECKGGKWYPN